MGKREDRQEVVRELVRMEKIKTQAELVEHMSKRGFVCTQATASRDVQDLGLVKGPNGCYALPEDYRLQRLVSHFVRSATAACNLVVVRTEGGSAGSLAAALDNSDIAGMLGTVAGDDTLFVACATADDAVWISTKLSECIRR